MSRIGNKPVLLPAGCTTTVNGNLFSVKGPKGELSFEFNKIISLEITDGQILVKRPDDSKWSRTIHGTTRAIINNMVQGVSNGFSKTLEINGVGYRAQLQGKKLIVSAGYSNNVEKDIPEGLTVECPKNTIINISGIDKQLVGQFAAEVRAIRKPEPYKGKGIKYSYETIRRKEGKTAKK